MGDFILYQKTALSAEKAGVVEQCLGQQGSVRPVMAAHGGYVVKFFPKQLSPVQNFISDARGDFCGASGTFIYKGLMGKAALTSLLQDFSLAGYRPEDFGGIFTVILRKENRLYLLTDPMGGNRVYSCDNPATNDRAGGFFWSSSFLAAATAAEKLSPRPQAIYEYVFQETTYDTDTVFQEINSLDGLKIFELTDDGPVAHDKRLTFDFTSSSVPRQALLEETIDLLRRQVRPMARLFGGQIHTALSGGYDSRLMLALLQDSGSMPGVYVYGSDTSPDVRIAQQIAKGEGFPLDHINKARHPVPDPEAYQAILKNNFYGLDGLPNEGIFDFGANMETRRHRADHGYMTFNGGGGEIYRNFFYLPDRSYRLSDLISSFYSRYSPRLCQNNFREQDYRDRLRAKIAVALGLGDGAQNDQLSRTMIEYAYPAFRLRYWTCRDNNNNCRLGPYFMPFINYAVIRQALTIPLALKNHGQFQAAVIEAISPALAAYPSDYGYSFDSPVPTKTLIKNYLTNHRPLFLRRYSYGIKRTLARIRMPDLWPQVWSLQAGMAPLPRNLEADYMPPFLKTGPGRMKQWFRTETITDTAMLGRLYTLEYLFEHFGL